MDLCLLYRGGHVHGVEGAGVLVAAGPREGERNHGGLLPLGEEVQEGEPNGSVLNDEEEEKQKDKLPYSTGGLKEADDTEGRTYLTG